MKILANKTALITGSSRGIGLGVGRKFVDNGAQVVLTSEQSLEQALAEISGTQTDKQYNAEVLILRQLLESGNAHYVQADMGNDEEIERLVEEAWKLLGTIEILVNNVGIYKEPAFLEITREDFDRVFGINVWSHIKTTQEFVRRRMAENSGGRILHTTSVNDERSEPGHTLYDPTKAAVSAIVRQLAIELAPNKFTTMGIAAGLHETRITDFGLRSEPRNRELIEGQIPLGIGSVEDVAYWYPFAASDAARYATGTILRVDGGITPMQIPVRPIAENEG